MEGEFNLIEMYATLVYKASEDIKNGVGKVDDNIKIIDECTKKILELQGQEARDKKVELEILKMQKEIEKMDSDSKDAKFDRALKIAGMSVTLTSAVVPSVIGLVMLNKQINFTEKMFKAITVTTETGIIPVLNNTKVLNSLFEKCLKR